MKPTNTVAKLFSSVSTLAVVAGAMALNSVASGQVGQVVAWGRNWNGQCAIPAAAQSGVTAIAGGERHSIALKAGSVLAWGDNSFGQCTIPDTAKSGVTAIAGGFYHSIALKDGRVIAWGAGTSNTGANFTEYGQSLIPADAQSGVVAIAGGGLHTIALKDGRVIAWGAGSTNTGSDYQFGQCAIPGAAQSGVTAIAGGGYHSLALKNDGNVITWGDNSFVQLWGQVSQTTAIEKIAVGGYHSITLKNGGVLAWGRNYEGQCSTAAAQSGVTAIAGGFYHTIALKGGSVLAWGDNSSGQCTIPVAATSGITAIAGGAYHTIALKSYPVTIMGVLPISGASTGGTNITITGTNFEAHASVTIGGAPATNVVVVSDTQITATTPAGFPGPAVVTVNLGSSTAFYYRPSCGSDLDNNGVVDSADLGIVLLDFGNCYESAAAAPQEPMIFPIEAAKPVAVKK